MKIAKLLQSAMVVLGLVGVTQLIPVSTVSAAGADVLTESCKTNPSSALCTKSLALFGPNSLCTKIINTLIFVIGAIAVVMIVIGGFRYTISGGDSGQVNGAKNTILYAVIGLVIAILSYGIVNFVLARL